MCDIREMCLSAFNSYVASYNGSDERIALKVEHTYEVAELRDEIARGEGLPRPTSTLLPRVQGAENGTTSEWSSILSSLRTSRARLSRIRLCTISFFMAMVLPLIGVALVLGKRNAGANQA